MIQSRVVLLILTIFLITTLACAKNMTKNDSPISGQPVAVNTLPDDKEFSGGGVAPEFGQAKNNAYADVLKKAVIFLIGEPKYNQNKGPIDDNILSYINGRKYILGETSKAPAEKQKRWPESKRDDSGNYVLKLQAFVNLKQLKSDLDALALKDAPQNTPAPVAQTGSSAQSSGAAQSAPGVNAAVDLSAVDISALSFLVYYNPKDPALENDSEQKVYAKWAVDQLNKEMAALKVQVVDLDAAEKLAGERSLLQEASAGNTGIGLLLAQKVFAELYSEVTPAVSYQGNRAHVIVTAKVYVRTTGALIATIEKGGQEYELVNLNASIKASMREAVRKVRDDLVISLKNYVNSGRFYFVRLTGLASYRDASKFSSTVNKMDGVMNVTLKSGSKQDMVYDYSVQFKGSPTELMDKLFEILPDKPGFEKIDLKEIRGNELTFSLD